MEKYCVATFKKNKRNSVKNLQKEANREWENPEKYKSKIDQKKQNIYLKKSENWDEKIDEILQKNGVKERKNSVVLTTTIYGFSADWEQELLEKYDPQTVEKWKKDYFQKCYEFEQTRGECINFVIHTDEEGNWHAHAATVPIISKEVVDENGNKTVRKGLSAKEIFGNRMKMSKDQTEFYEMCGKPFGMKRGKCRIQDKPGAVKHLTETEYKAKQELEKANAKAEEIQRQADHSLRVANGMKKKWQEFINQQLMEKFKEKEEALAKQKKAADERKEALDATQSEQDARESALDAREERIKQREGTIRDDEEKARKKLADVKKLVDKAFHAKKVYDDELDNVKIVAEQANTFLENAKLLDEGFAAYARKCAQNANIETWFDEVVKSYDKSKVWTKDEGKSVKESIARRNPFSEFSLDYLKDQEDELSV